MAGSAVFHAADITRRLAEVLQGVLEGFIPFPNIRYVAQKCKDRLLFFIVIDACVTRGYDDYYLMHACIIIKARLATIEDGLSYSA